MENLCLPQENRYQIKFAESEKSVAKRKKQSTDDWSNEINLLSVELQALTVQSAKKVAHTNDLKEEKRCPSSQKESCAMLVERLSNLQNQKNK